MFKRLAVFINLLPLCCFAQFTISGRVINQDDTRPVANVNVFLNNSSIGDKTGNSGSFTLTDVKPGKYELIVSIVGFENYRQTVQIEDKNIVLQTIKINPKIILLNEVKIKPVTNANRERYLDWFKEEFLGRSVFALDCKIINPEIIDLDYDETTKILTASSTDFIEIENQALGYRIKYLLTAFSLNNGPAAKYHLNYEGSALLDEMKGTPSQEKRWKNHRLEVYEGSAMHFLRSALDNRIDQEGFRALRLRVYANPARPDDSLINAKINYYKKSDAANHRDSLSYWNKKAKLPKMLEWLNPSPLKKDSIIRPTNQNGLFAFGPGNLTDAIYISYNKDQNFSLNFNGTYLSDPRNKENTRVNFDSPFAFFDRNGGITNPNSIIVSGVWGRNRVAELLPVNYVTPANANIVQDSTVANNIFSKLSRFKKAQNPERAYMHFDKPYYAAGDTIYFKAYVTMGERHELSNLSGVLHVDLINSKNKIDQSIKLQLDSGIAWGDFALPDSLPNGNYRVRAYTQLMRIDGTSSYFDQPITFGSIKSIPVSKPIVTQPTPVPDNKADIRFLPEGGSLVAGIRSKVAFKAIGINGQGINVKGKIVDDKNNQITDFESIHLGMGYFYLKPEVGRNYQAQPTYADGTQIIVDLPVPDAKGIALAVNNDNLSHAAVRIIANNAYYKENKNKDYTLIIYSGGIATSIVRTLDSASVSLEILKRHLPSGIATITLFSPVGEPLCERLLFVQNYDQLKLSAVSDKAVYAKREKVNIKLSALTRAGDPATGHFSVSVTDENKVPVDENNESTILNNLLLTSDLKGYVEQPNYYFADTITKVRKNLDILMLTQGYRRLEWKQVVDSSYVPITLQSEKGLEISGMIKSLSGRTITNGKVALLPTTGGPMLNGISDDKGIFHFSNLIFSDTTHFVLSAVNAQGKNSTKISWIADKPEPVPSANWMQKTQTVPDTAMAAYLENTKKERNEVLNYGRGKRIMLKEVKIREKKADDQYKTQSLAGPGNADQVMHADEIEQIGGQLATSLDGRLHGITLVRASNGSAVPYLTINLHSGIGMNAPAPMQVIVDGAEEVSPYDINQIPSTNIETIEVLRYASASIYGMNGGGGVLIITTKQGGGINSKDVAPIGVLPITPKGFYKAREFYSPKYDHTDLAGKQQDFRSTIYWNPELKTDKNGNASVNYFNADGKGTYRIVIEGIDDKGNLGRQVFRYKVE
jgi:hypothetical protein